MKKTMRVLATLSILASSMLFAQPATAVENPYANGNGNVACINNGQESGYFVIASYKVTHQINCRGAAIVPTGVTELLANAFINTAITSIVIPNTVTSIGDYAFAEASALTSIVIPDSVTYLGNDVFKDARALTSATLGRTTQIGTSAFRRTGITSIVIPDSVTLINNAAFLESALTSIIIPDSVTQINDYAFANSSSLQSVTIGEGVTYIKDAAFTGLSSLTSLIIGSNVNQMDGASTFSGANALTTYTYCGSLSKSTLDYRAGWGPQKVNNCVPKATVIAGSEPNSKVATFASGITLAEIPVSSGLPAIKLTFVNTPSSSVIVKPTLNPVPLSATPFMTTGSPIIVDITFPGGHDGSDVKICLDGDSTDHLYHFTGGAWVELTGRTYENNQVCGYTNSFSPFVAAPVNPVTAPGAPTIGTATATGTTTATISFTAPASDGGSTITKYIATSTPGSITGEISQAGSGTISVTGLFAATAYTFTVTAINSAGTSVASSASNSITTFAPGIAPLFSTGGAYAGMYTVQITNYDPDTTYTATTTNGSASIDSNGLISVTGLGVNQSATVTVTTTKTGYGSGTGSVTGSSQVAPMLPSSTPSVVLSQTLIMCTMGSHSAAPTSSVFSLFVDGEHISTNFSAVGDYLPDWIIPWASTSTITRTASLTSATWAMSDAYKGKSITCTTLAYSNNATGLTSSQKMMVK